MRCPRVVAVPVLHDRHRHGVRELPDILPGTMAEGERFNQPIIPQHDLNFVFLTLMTAVFGVFHCMGREHAAFLRVLVSFVGCPQVRYGC